MLSSIASFIRRALFSLLVVTGPIAPETAPAASPSPQVANALAYLRQKMDQYRNFGVYADKFSVSNHFEPTGWMGDAKTTPGVVTFDPGNTATWHMGGNSIRITYTGAGSQGWAGIYWQHPKKNWGTDPNGGFSLTSATRLTFWARGRYGGEKAEFKVGGIGGRDVLYGDTIQPAISTGVVTLTKTWRQYAINLAGKDLSRVVGGFVWATSRTANPNGATIYLDDIRYEGFSRKLRLIESYTNLTTFVPPRPLDTHKYLYVYLDYDSPYNSFFNNGFYGSAWMGDYGAISVNMNETAIKHSGASAMRWSYSGVATQGQQWAGVYWQAPAYFWGDRVGGYNLTGAARLTFWARGAVGGEKVRFLLGGVNGPYNDSLQPARKSAVLSLTPTWTKYAIDLAGAKLTRIGGGFGWIVEQANNPGGATFYLDDVRYENAANPARGVYRITRDTFPPDAYAMMAAHTYDNALALLAFLATGDKARARLLADSLVWAQQHDEFRDGRIRNVYYPDDLATGTTFGGDGKIARHNHDKYGNGAGPGNMGWTMIALLNYYQTYGGDRYKNAALAMGQWIHNNCYDTRGAGGYTAGYNGWPPSVADVLKYKSTEHNIDIYVAFVKLYEITGDVAWKRRAMHAKAFVASMWKNAGAYFYAGTKADGVTPSIDNFPVDVMPWGFLAMGEMDKYGRGLASAFNRHYASERVGSHVFEGVDFNTDKDGVWWEGTAHMVTGWWALYYFSSGAMQSKVHANAIKYQHELREAQIYAPRNNGKGIVSTVHDKLTTGFDLPAGGRWYYYNRLHIGATAWFIFAEQQWNPYWGIPANRPIPYQYEYSVDG